MSGTNWDGRFWAMAEMVSTWSKDPRKQVGAVLVSPDRRRFALGYNGLPAGFPDDVTLDRDTKNRYTLHAETNAIAQAATDVRGWTMYVTHPPCIPCALALHRAGVVRIVTRDLDPSSLWYEETKEASDFLGSMGIEQGRVQC